MTIFMLETYILNNEQNPDLGKQDKWPSFMNNKQEKNKKGEKESVEIKRYSGDITNGWTSFEYQSK